MARHVDLIEPAPARFAPGNVLCYEPRITARDQSFFMEDMFVITVSGHEQLSPDLPW